MRLMAAGLAAVAVLVAIAVAGAAPVVPTRLAQRTAVSFPLDDATAGGTTPSPLTLNRRRLQGGVDRDTAGGGGQTRQRRPEDKEISPIVWAGLAFATCLVVCSDKKSRTRVAEVDIAKEIHDQLKAGATVTATVLQNVVVREGKSTKTSAKLGRLAPGDVVKVVSCSVGAKSKGAKGKIRKTRVEVQLPETFVRNEQATPARLRSSRSCCARRDSVEGEQPTGWINLFNKKSQVLQVHTTSADGAAAFADRQRDLARAKRQEEARAPWVNAAALSAMVGITAGSLIHYAFESVTSGTIAGTTVAGLVALGVCALHVKNHRAGMRGFEDYNYAGPGTLLLTQLETGAKPVNELDWAALGHDIAYFEVALAVDQSRMTQEEARDAIQHADEVFLQHIDAHRDSVNDDAMSWLTAKATFHAKAAVENAGLLKVGTGSGNTIELEEGDAADAKRLGTDRVQELLTKGKRMLAGHWGWRGGIDQLPIPQLMPGHQPQAAPSMQLVQVIAPPGVAAGQLIEIEVSGTRYRVALPPGVQPGQMITVTIPIATGSAGSSATMHNMPVATRTTVVNSPLGAASAALAAASAASDDAFLRYDSDRSGTLTKDECMDFIAGAGLSLSRGYVEGAWAVYDVNEDGVLDREEFHSFYQVMLTRSRRSQPVLVGMPGGLSETERI
jgi:hypothetical protein